MNSHNHPDDLLDLSLRHSLKNWTAHKSPPSEIREQLLATARQQKEAVKRPKPARFSFSGWSFQFQYNFNEMTLRSIYRYNLESVYTLKAMAVS